MDLQVIKPIVESVLLVADGAVSLSDLVKVFDGDVSPQELKAVLENLIADYRDRSFQVIEIAEGYRFATRQEHAEWIRRFLKVQRRVTLSRPALETISIIAYKQPITKAEIEAIRGVDVSAVLRTLLERQLIRIIGRKKVVGRPLLYGSAQKFLEYFGLRQISDLPPLQQILEETGGQGADATLALFGDQEQPDQEGE
jgi:segregation and condensation protein B